MTLPNENRPSLFADEADELLVVAPTTINTHVDVAEPAEPPQTSEAVQTPETSSRERHEPKEDQPRPRRNPWLAVLWVIAVVFVCAGVWARIYGIELENGMHLSYLLGTGEGTTYSAPSVTDFYVLPVVLSTFAPWLVAAGLLAAVAATFVHALQWMRRNAS